MSKNNGHDKNPPHKSESPLKKIKEKELEFSGKYLEAKKQAEMIIADARKKSNEIKSNAKDEALKEAETYYKQKFSLLLKDKNKFDNNETVKAKNIAEKNYKKAYEFLLKEIIPNV
ncbi:MAG: hypothetical protein AB1498_09170 [bacterium]